MYAGCSATTAKAFAACEPVEALTVSSLVACAFVVPDGWSTFAKYWMVCYPKMLISIIFSATISQLHEREVCLSAGTTSSDGVQWGCEYLTARFLSAPAFVALECHSTFARYEMLFENGRVREYFHATTYISNNVSCSVISMYKT